MPRPKSTPVPAVSGNPAAGARRGFPPRWLIAALGVLLGVAVILGVAGDQAPAVFAAFIHWIFVLPIVAAAAMLGLLLTEPFACRALFAHSPWPNGLRLVTAIALGLGAFALATLALGTVQLVEPAGFPWPLLAIPLAGAAIGFRATQRFTARLDRSLLTGHAQRGEWLLILAAVPVAILVIAAAFPPGSLWAATEAKGYDVLEYHLELPREYALNNSTAPLAHNVYSFFPANVEMLYLLQMQFAKTIMGADRDTSYVWGAYPAQFLHALLMLLTAAAIGLFPIGTGQSASSNTSAAAEAPPHQDPVLDYASPAISVPNIRWFGPTGRAIAVLLFLGIPWTLITGSLAYNEAGMLLFGTLALGLAFAPPADADRQARPLLVGILLGLAVGCKMTAGVFFALPVALLYLLRAADRAQIRALLLAAAVAAGVYLPWAVRAAAYTHGNPVFPIATSWLPRDAWTARQTARFDQGHAAPASRRSPVARLRALFSGSLLDAQWSLQPYPVLQTLLNGNESPPPQLDGYWTRLGLLWLAVPLALAGAFLTRQGRAEAAALLGVGAVQVLAWLLATHLQSRFLLPTAIPLALLAGRGIQGLHTAREAIPVAALRIVAGTIVALHALAAAWVLLPETDFLAGIAQPPGNTSPAPVGAIAFGMANVAALVEGRARPDTPIAPEKVLLLGDARAWIFPGPVEYFTVFDTNPPLDALRHDPRQLAAWLERRHIRYVWVNWYELARLNNTYGLDLEVAPGGDWREQAARLSAVYGPHLKEAGLQDTQASTSPLLTIYRAPDALPK